MIWLDDGAARSPELRTEAQRLARSQPSKQTRGQQVAAEAVRLVESRHRVDGYASLSIEGTTAAFAMPINPLLSEGGVEIIRKHLAELIDRELAEAVKQYKREMVVNMNLDVKLAEETKPEVSTYRNPVK